MMCINWIASVVLLCFFVASIHAGHDEHEHAHHHLWVGLGPLPPPQKSHHTNGARTGGTLKILTPAQLKSIYGMSTSTTAGSGKTIALINAYGASQCESDLGTFSTQWGLPACTTANGCFKKLNQTCGTTYPADDSNPLGWGFEANMDVQAAHAFAPGAKKILVVAKSASFTDLFAAIGCAKTQGATYISMSFGGTEGSWQTSYESIFSSSTVSFFASTGDNGSGGGIEYPSSGTNVVAVGGTSLYTLSDYTLDNTPTGNGEQGWVGSGGGCSAVTAALANQKTKSGYACGNFKSIPDVSWNANASSGMYTYYSKGGCTPPNCWYGGGGTSLSAPATAAHAAVKGVVANPAYFYTSPAPVTFRDITIGSNGGYTCASGLDRVTGLGSWTGL